QCVQAEDGIRGRNVTGVQTCAPPIWKELMETTPDCPFAEGRRKERLKRHIPEALTDSLHAFLKAYMALEDKTLERFYREEANTEIGRASCRERGEIPVFGGTEQKTSM